MSRALTIDAAQEHVMATCAKHQTAISAIEVLPGGYTRVVLCSGDGAAIIRRAYGKGVITTPVARTPLAVVARRQAETLGPMDTSHSGGGRQGRSA